MKPRIILASVAALAALAAPASIFFTAHAFHRSDPAPPLAHRRAVSTVSVSPVAPFPTFGGEAALAHLNQRGLSVSLRQAVREARVDSQRLTADQGEADDSFGAAVAISGMTAVVGAPSKAFEEDDAQGAAFVFEFDGTRWAQQGKLKASDGDALDQFGHSVAISGDTIVVGAYNDESGASLSHGSAYVFERNGAKWEEREKLVASDGAEGDSFGYAVAVSGEVIVVGAPTDEIGGNPGQGSAYVFRRRGAGWEQQEKLEASDGAAEDVFGISVAIDGETIVVGASRDDVDGKPDQGSAYVFERDGALWPQEKIEVPDGAADDLFGYSVAVDGGLIAIGAPLSDVDGHPDQGSAYLFENDGLAWRAQAKLEASGGRAGDYFGYSVALNGETVAIGAPVDAVGGNTDQGSACVFRREDGTWTEQERLEAPDGLSGDYFGYSIAVGGKAVLVGAMTDDVNGEVDQGSVYAFAFEPCPAIALDPASLPGGAVGVAYHQDVTASGGAGPFIYALVSGSLPPGLVLDPATGALSGTPSAAGTYQFTVEATDGNGCPGSRDYTLAVDCAEIALGPSELTLPSGTAGAPYGQGFTASGGTEPYTFGVSVGALPAGLTLDPTTGILFGTPEVSGEFLFAVEVTDAGGCFASAIYELTIACATLAVEPGGRNLPDGVVGATYAQQFSATGGSGSYTFDVATGALPGGMTLDPSTGELSGTPESPGTFRFAIRATDGNGCSGRNRYRLVVN